MRNKILILCLSLVITSNLKADIVYLKDGKVLENVKITDANTRRTKVEQNGTETVYTQDQVKRIRFGQNKMEKVNILMQSGSLRTAYIVEQDTNAILVRPVKHEDVEESINKDDIKQMSRKDIVLLHPGITLRSGYFIPTNTGRTGIQGAPVIYGGVDMRIPFLSSSRFNVELGFANSKSESEDERALDVVPLNGIFTYSWSLTRRFALQPRLGLTSALLTFGDGEGDSFQGLTFGATAGAGIQFEALTDSMYLAAFADYSFLHDGTAMLHSIALSFGVAYRL